MKAVILAGGLGTRMREETEFRPKPMVEIGGQPVLWHIMKILSSQGINDFIICAGYKSEHIKNYFINYSSHQKDFTVQLGSKETIKYHGAQENVTWNVTVADTGASTMTGGRLLRIADYLDGEDFLCTYGDGIADVDLGALVDHHRNSGRLATMTTTQPMSRFGVVDISKDGIVSKFREKPRVDDWINIGYFIFKRNVLEYITGDDCVLEEKPLHQLALDNQLAGYKHSGFWEPMDTYRESVMLNELWETGKAPWKIW